MKKKKKKMGDKDNPPQKHKGGHKDANNFSISTDLYHSADPRFLHPHRSPGTGDGSGETRRVT